MLDRRWDLLDFVQLIIRLPLLAQQLLRRLDPRLRPIALSKVRELVGRVQNHSNTICSCLICVAIVLGQHHTTTSCSHSNGGEVFGI